MYICPSENMFFINIQQCGWACFIYGPNGQQFDSIFWFPLITLSVEEMVLMKHIDKKMDDMLFFLISYFYKLIKMLKHLNGGFNYLNISLFSMI